MGSGESVTTPPPGDEAWLRRGRRRLLAEHAFASCVGATLTGPFLTALVLAFGGKELRLGLAIAATHIGSVGMLLTNPILNRIGSRRTFCLIWLGAVRGLRLVIAALPALIWAGLAPQSLYWPFAACVLVSSFFGMSAEISRRNWISDLVGPAQRGRYFGWRVTIGVLVQAAVLLAGGKLLDLSKTYTQGHLAGLIILVGFGAAMGWAGWTLLYHAPEPPMIAPRRRTGLLRSLLLPWLRPRFRGLLLAAGSYSLATGICAGFFDYYMIDHLGMKFAWITAVDTVGLLAAGVGAARYGAWADRAGARRVLTVAMLFKGIFPATWVLVTPEHWQWTFLVVLLRTFNSAGEICWLRLSLNLSPARNQAAFLAMHQALMRAGQALGAFAGGDLAQWLRDSNLQLMVMGFRLVPLHVLFLISAAARLSCLPLLRFIREPRRSMPAPPPAAEPPQED